MTPGTCTLSRQIADYAYGFDLDRVPPEVVTAAGIAMLDTIGVLLAGSRSEAADIVLQMVRDEGGTPRCGVVGQGLRTSPQLAALANGVAVHALDYDFTLLRGQSASAVLPALLPLAEVHGASPRACLSAFVIGCEIAARLARASPQTSSAGWHATGVIGAIAATAACAKLIALAPAAMAHALGIAASLSSGVSANFGTMTKPLHSGNAARNGVTAVTLAARGFTAQAGALDGPNGYFSTFSRGLEVDLSPFLDLGRTYNLLEPSFKLKRYPSGGLGHSAIDAILTLRADLPGGAANVSAIDVGLPQATISRISDAYPTTTEEAKFSMPFIGAWTLLRGAPGISTFTDAGLRDPDVIAMAKRISRRADPELFGSGEESPGRVTVTTRDGGTMTATVLYPSGSRQNPMSSASIHAKFLDCATQVLTRDSAMDVLAWVESAPHQRTFDRLWSLIHPPLS